MNKKGFTLMELLLVVAILAIVAAAAAPTFTSGASDALKEARKSGFLSAYQNTVTGAHMMVALAASKGSDTADIGLDQATSAGYEHNLDYYAPIATRQFKNSKGTVYTLGAAVTSEHVLYIGYKKGSAVPTKDDVEGSGKIDIYASGKDSSKVLDETWTAIEAEN